MFKLGKRIRLRLEPGKPYVLLRSTDILPLPALHELQNLDSMLQFELWIDHLALLSSRNFPYTCYCRAKIEARHSKGRNLN